MLSSLRKISQTLKSKPTLEGAGVHLKRVFGYSEMPTFDPFLLMDDFHSSNPDDYLAGFPWHPHRGIETITYMLQGEVAHKDSMGNSGLIREGEVQWMTAGSGIIHQEMPDPPDGRLWGFQLWANLPGSHKMIDPRYRSLTPDQIPQVSPQKNVTIKIICGEVAGIKGPVHDIIIEPQYLDISMEPETTYEHPVQQGHTVFAYVIEGEGTFDKEGGQVIPAETVALFEDGDGIRVTTAKETLRFLLISGKPIREPIAWGGPIVMNTKAELKLAMEEYQNGTFIKKLT